MLAFLADVHLGTKLSNHDYLKSLDSFLGLIKEHKEQCHCILVLGDLFDHRLTIDEARFASVFLLNLVCNYCGKNGRTHVPVHFIHGTYTHDYEQYEIYLNLLKEIDNVEVFYTKETCVGKLRNGMSILYLPQIYGDFDYTPYFNQEYDIIVGHGPISNKTKTPCRSSQYEIMHSADQLGSISKLCVFGHYHEYTEFDNNVYYAGSMLRFRYGEDETKRFFICDDNFNVETIPNNHALEYKTIEISDPEELRDIISNEITTPHRFIIKSDKDSLSTYHAIMETNKKNTNLKYNIMSIDDCVDKESINPIDIKNVSSIEDPILSLIKFINDKYDIDTTDEINSYRDKIINKGD